MSEGLNRVILLGNLGADPELRYTSTGQAFLKMRLATNESWLDKNKERQEKTEWHSVTVWGPRAESLAKLLAKGSGVLVEGGLRTSSYEKDGVVRYTTEVVARDVFFAGKRTSMLGRDAASHVDDASALPLSGAPPARAQRNGSKAAPAEMQDEIPF